MNDQIDMKPLLGKLIERAFVFAVSDCIAPPEQPGKDQDDYDKRKLAIQRDVYNVTDEDWAQIDPMALAQNVCCRLLGTGGWSVNGVYAPNATVQQVVNACFGAEASRDPLGGIIEAMGLEPADD